MHLLIKIIILLNTFMKYFNNINQQAAFLIQTLCISKDSIGVDIGCGDGDCLTIIQEIAPKSYGVDNKKAEIANFYQLDIFSDNLPIKELDFAYCMAPYFGENWWNIQFLFDSISSSLKSEGLFCLDLFNFNSFEVGKTIQKYKISDNDVQLSTVKREIDKMTGSRVILKKDWTKKQIDLLWRVFTREEISKLAFESGMKLIEEYTDFNFNKDVSWEPNLAEKRILLIFKKI